MYKISEPSLTALILRMFSCILTRKFDFVKYMYSFKSMVNIRNYPAVSTAGQFKNLIF